MYIKFLYNNTKRKVQRRHLRFNVTEPEKMLWTRLRKKQLGYTFRRQYSIGPYIVDFYCPKKRVAVEIDGLYHNSTTDYDEYRTKYLNALDVKVLRFKNEEVDESLDEVVARIRMEFPL